MTNLEMSNSVMTQIWTAIIATHNAGGNISEKLVEYTKEAQSRDSCIATLIKLYQEEIQKLKCNIPKNTLSRKQKNAVGQEMKILKDICDKKIRRSSVKDVSANITPSIFKDILDVVHLKCPLIHDMIETLVISNPASKNILKANADKMLCGVQILGFMSYIRNLNTKNCFPMLVGLLCISYGAGKQFVDMLQSMGLSLHWTTM